MADTHSIYTRRFWTDTVERVVRTTAQVALTVFGIPVAADAADVHGTALTALSWEDKLTIIGVTALLTFLTALAGRTTGDTSTASLTKGTVEPVDTAFTPASMAPTVPDAPVVDDYIGQHRAG